LGEQNGADKRSNEEAKRFFHRKGLQNLVEFFLERVDFSGWINVQKRFELLQKSRQKKLLIPNRAAFF
jgi:hypothetical protein